MQPQKECPEQGGGTETIWTRAVRGDCRFRGVSGLRQQEFNAHLVSEA